MLTAVGVNGINTFWVFWARHPEAQGMEESLTPQPGELGIRVTSRWATTTPWKEAQPGCEPGSPEV